MKFSERPEAYVARICQEVFSKADSNEFQSDPDLPSTVTLQGRFSANNTRPSDRIYPNFQPIDNRGVEISAEVRLLLPAVVYQPTLGIWTGNTDPDGLLKGMVRLGKPNLIAQTIQVDLRDDLYPRAIFLGEKIVDALIDGQRVSSVSGPSFDYDQDPGEAPVHRRIYTFTITV